MSLGPREFRLLDPEQFRACFQRFMARFAETCQGVIAIDGKEVRRSFDKVGCLCRGGGRPGAMICPDSFNDLAAEPRHFARAYAQSPQFAIVSRSDEVLKRDRRHY